jgi:hypothetical protein
MGVEAEDEEQYPDMDDEDAPINMVSRARIICHADDLGRRLRRRRGIQGKEA